MVDEFTQQKSWELYVSFAMKCADDLRKTLPHEEREFAASLPISYADPKWILVYRALDEVQKGAICVQNWSELLEDGDKTDPNIPPQVDRIVRHWLRDEQSFRRRKLVEVLVELICFSRTNEATYYRDFFLLKELHEAVQGVNDQHSFFGFRRENTVHYVRLLSQQVQALESKLELTKRWYLNPPHRFRQQWLRKGVTFSSFRSRFKSIFDIALPHERVILGKSYLHAYGQSVDIHFSAQQTRTRPRSENVELGVDIVGILCLDIIIRCQLLLDVVPDGSNRKLRDMWDSNEFPGELLKESTAPNISKGDFVVVLGYGDLCEVVGSLTSGFGYVSYSLRYLQTPPMPTVPVDWFAAGEIRLVLPRAKVVEALDQIPNDPIVDEETRERFVRMTDENRSELIRNTAIRMFDALREVTKQRS